MSEPASQPLPDHPSIDPDSGAPNRALLLQVLAPVLALGRRNSRAMAALHVRVPALDGTDGLAERVVGVIREAVRECDMVARVGPDGFSVALLEVWEPDAAVRVARRMLLELGAKLGVDASAATGIGVAFFPHDAPDGPALLEAAERSTPATGSLGFADPALGREALRRAGLMEELTGSDAISQFHLHYQPIRSVRGGDVVGAEALLRWERSDALLPAADFIGMAEASGRIRAIDRWSMERALTDLRAWREAGWGGWVAVNLSARSLVDPELPDVVARLLASTGAPADGLVFEITERSALGGTGSAGDVLREIRAQGIRIAVDDFGTGYASFEYLTTFDPDVVKLDRAFTVEPAEPGATNLLAMLVEMAHRMGKPVVVEGVEEPTEWDRVAASRCEFVQGYFTGRPVSRLAFTRQHIGVAA